MYASARREVVGEDTNNGGKEANLFEMLEKTMGYEIATLISCIPGRVAYYEGDGNGISLKVK